LVSEPHFEEVRGDTFELFSLSTMVPELGSEMCTARLFLQGVDLFALRFYLDRVLPLQPFLASEN